mmetsp:Transcript_41751/g.103747  ORF Transcript_41751/g.103747 Transcript_41751/m.103747 type:complete len:215 (-) Transcript_41751:411-1055(-)
MSPHCFEMKKRHSENHSATQKERSASSSLMEPAARRQAATAASSHAAGDVAVCSLSRLSRPKIGEGATGASSGGGRLCWTRATTKPRRRCASVALSRSALSSAKVMGMGEEAPVKSLSGGSSMGTTTESKRKSVQTSSARTTASSVMKTCTRRPEQLWCAQSHAGVHDGTRKSSRRTASATRSAIAPARLKTAYCTPNASPRVLGVVSFLSATV